MGDAPLLVIGVGRGGTSILTACLDGHPQLVMRSEFRTAETLMGDGYAVSGTDRLIEDRLVGFRGICEAEAANFPGMVWGNKLTTEQFAGLEEHNLYNEPQVDVVDCFLEKMAGYRLVFILRNGVPCVASKVRRTGQGEIRAALRWSYGARLFLRLQERGALTHWCRYEDLVADPRVTLSALCAALGINFAEEMLGQTSSELMLPDYRHGRFVAEKALEMPAICPEAMTIITPWQARLGY